MIKKEYDESMNKIFLRHLKESLHRRLLVLIKLPIAMIIKHFTKTNLTRTWIVLDGNGDRWNDNGRAFFEYIAEKRQDISVYALCRHNTDNMPSASKTVKPLSLKAINLTLIADAIFFTHSYKAFGGRLVVNRSKAIRVFLGHGVTGIKKMHKIVPMKNDCDIVCCSSPLEKKYLLEAKYRPDQIVQTGFPRHDMLAAQAANRKPGTYILFTPTFRDWASDQDKEMFEKKLFSWIEKLQDQLPEMHVKTWVHPTWYKKIKGGFKQTRMREVLNYDSDVQKLLLRAAILVTDYSSIAFDAGIIGIPVVLFRPDKDSFSQKRGLYPYAQPSEINVEVFDENSLVKKLQLLVQQRQVYEEHVKGCQEWSQLHIKEFRGQNCQNLMNTVDHFPDDKKAI